MTGRAGIKRPILEDRFAAPLLLRDLYSARVGRPLSPAWLDKRYAISGPFSSFVVVPGGDHDLLVTQRFERIDTHRAPRRDKNCREGRK